MFSSCICGNEGGVLSEAGFSGWGGFSGWVGLWMEVVVRIGIWGIFGFRTIEWPWPGTVVARVVFGSCQVLRPVMTILGGKVVTTR